MSEQRAQFLEKSLIGTCAFVAVVLLASFYMVVSDAVHRGARQRMASVDAATHAAAAATLPRSAARGAALLARVGN